MVNYLYYLKTEMTSLKRNMTKGVRFCISASYCVNIIFCCRMELNEQQNNSRIGICNKHHSLFAFFNSDLKLTAIVDFIAIVNTYSLNRMILIITSSLSRIIYNLMIRYYALFHLGIN